MTPGGGSHRAPAQRTCRRGGGQVHPVQTRYDVIRARTFGLAPQEVHRVTGVPPRTQSRLIREEIPFDMTDAALRSARGVGRPPSEVASEGV
jgi:hypothetical protein